MEVKMETVPGMTNLPPQQSVHHPIPSPTQPSHSPSGSPRKRSIDETEITTTDAKGETPGEKENTVLAAQAQPSFTTPTQPENIDHPHKPETTLTSYNPTTNDVVVQIPRPNPSALNSIPAPNIATDGGVTGATTATPAAKKRKLSPGAKEAKERERVIKQQEKEARERQKAEDKTRREEEKRVRDEEKKKREAEREEEKRKRETERDEKRKAKDEEKAAREEEKRKREEEKTKKERVSLVSKIDGRGLIMQSQTKLGAFFAKPALPDRSPKKCPNSPTKDSDVGAVVTSDYGRAFPDFFLQSNTTLAPIHRFERDSEGMAHVRARIDGALRSDDGQAPSFNAAEVFRLMPYRRRRGRQVGPVKEILMRIQNLGDAIDGEGASETSTQLQNVLRGIPMKSLKFGEDVRPPYQGTYTKSLAPTSADKLSRNPFYRGLPEIDYDYDSEAEWEDPGEGEDLDSEEEEDASEEGDDDMEGFLDDEDDQLVDGKRRLIVGDLEPVCSGICWSDQISNPELEAYRMATISDTINFPIDPFSTAYWQKPRTTQSSEKTGAAGPIVSAFGSGPTGHISTSGDRGVPAVGRVKRPFPPEHLAEFKQAVDGSDLSKTGLVEVLKKK